MRIRTAPTFSLRLLHLAVLLLLLPNLAAGQSVCDRALVAGWEPWEPFQFQEKGVLKGYDIEVIRAVAQDMGCEVEFRKLPWARHLEELKKGQVDMASGAYKTAEREVFGKFSAPYRQDEVRLWVRLGEAASYAFDDLAALATSEFRLGVTRSYLYGPIYGDLIEKQAFQEEQLIHVDSEEQLLPMLARKRIDGFLAERANFAAQVRSQEFQGEFEAHAIEISSEAAYVLFSRKSISDDVLAAFDQSLEKIREDGTLEAIEAKYLQ